MAITMASTTSSEITPLRPLGSRKVRASIGSAGARLGKTMVIMKM